MNKREWTWFVIRVFGLCLLLDAVKALPRVISSLYYIIHQSFLPSITNHGDKTIDYLQILRSTMGSLFVSSFVELLVFSAMGIYLLRGSTFLFKLICPPDEP